MERQPTQTRDRWFPASALYQFSPAENADARRQEVSRWARRLHREGSPAVRRTGRFWELRGDVPFRDRTVSEWLTERSPAVLSPVDEVIVLLGRTTVTIRDGRVEVRR